MKKPLFNLTLIFIMSLTILSCKNQEKKNQNDDPDQKTETTNYVYSPGEGWELVWSDEFEGSVLDSTNWNRQVEKAGQFNEEWQRYTNSEENSYLEGGNLVIKAIHESDEFDMDQFTSARLNTAQKQAWKYGKIVAKIKLPEGEGIWPAFWMLGANINENGGDTPWPQCGEIDILELYGSKDDSVVEGNIHYANAKDSHSMLGAISYKLKEGKFADDFHVFELDWNEQRMAWLVDGYEYASTQITSDELTEFHEEFFILLNIAVGGAHAGRPDATTTFPQYMYVDWVRVYQHNDE